MAEKSFILLKPDAMSNIQIQQYIFKSLDKHNLIIIFEKEILLKPDDVMVLWEFTLRDPVSRTILQLYLTNKVLRLMIIEGENALLKVSEIKQKTRKQYAKPLFFNCLHAPKNKQEYNRDINYLFYGKRHEVKSKLIYDLSKFSRFHKFDDKYYCWCAKQIYSYFKKKDLPILPIKKDLSDKKYLLYLHDDIIHELVYVVAAIYEFIPELTLVDSYLICFCAEIKKTVLLMGSNDKLSIEKVYNLLLKSGIVVSLCKKAGGKEERQ